MDKYLALCEQLGEEPDPEKMPPAMDLYPYEVQMAFFIYSLLQDTWDGMNGMYMGKNLAGLSVLLDIYEIEDKKTVVYFLTRIDNERIKTINEEVKRKVRPKGEERKRGNKWQKVRVQAAQWILKSRQVA